MSKSFINWKIPHATLQTPSLRGLCLPVFKEIYIYIYIFIKHCAVGEDPLREFILNNTHNFKLFVIHNVVFEIFTFLAVLLF